MTYQPRSIGKMEDFETLTFLNSSQMHTCFCKDVVTGYCLYLVNDSIFQPSSFFKLIFFPHLVAMDLASREICVHSE